jgi:hypothetical protein
MERHSRTYGKSVWMVETVKQLKLLGGITGTALPSYFIQAKYGAYGWIVLGTYPNRMLLTNLLHFVASLLPIRAWQLLWATNILLWWFAISVFDKYLQSLNIHSEFGAILPLLTLGGVVNAFVSIDAVFFITTVCVALALRKWTYAIPLPILFTFIITVNPFIPATLTFYHIKQFFISIHIWLPIAIYNFIKQQPKIPLDHIAIILLTVPIFIFTVDWYRWVVMLGVVWVPLVLEANKQ